MLAGISVDYLVRLEQGRVQSPSPQVIRSLAIALRLNEHERDHLYRSAGLAPPARGVVPRHITPGVHRIIDRLSDTPLAVFTATHDILLWNPLWAAVNGDPSQLTGLERNIVWQHFISGQQGMEFDDAHAIEFPDDLVADLRAATARYPADTALADMVARLRAESEEFEKRWAAARVAEHRACRKTLHTPAGPITVDCDVLTALGSDLKIVVYTTKPGTSDASKLDLLRVAGLQTFTVASDE